MSFIGFCKASLLRSLCRFKVKWIMDFIKLLLYIYRLALTKSGKLGFCLLLLSAAERRGTPVLLSASVSDNSGNSPQMAAPRRSREIDQSTQRFHVGCDNRGLFSNEYGGLHGREFFRLVPVSPYMRLEYPNTFSSESAWIIGFHPNMRSCNY